MHLIYWTCNAVQSERQQCVHHYKNCSRLLDAGTIHGKFALLDSNALPFMVQPGLLVDVSGIKEVKELFECKTFWLALPICDQMEIEDSVSICRLNPSCSLLKLFFYWQEVLLGDGGMAMKC